MSFRRTIGRMDGAVSADPDFAACKSTYSIRVCQLLLFKDQASQFVWSALVRYQNSSLQHNWPVVVFIVGKMHRAAADFHPAVNGGFVNMMSIQPMTTERGYE